MQRIYLDNAATSWPKPEAVYEAVDRYQREVGASFGRGSHRAALECARLFDSARSGLAELLGVSDPNRIVFANSGTDALATAINGLVGLGDHVVTTVVEHNAVLRPLHALGADVTLVGCDGAGRVDPEVLLDEVRDDTRLVALSHASNVTGAVQSIETVADRLRDHPARLLIDAAQTVGRWPLDIGRLGADFVAAPCHKGLLGPLGVGFVWIRPGLEPLLRPLRYGGTGADSASPDMPAAMPQRYEAGSLNAPGVVGLAAGVRYLLRVGVAAQQEAVAAAAAALRAGLTPVEGVRMIGGGAPAANAGVVAFNLRGYDPPDVAALLATVAGVECRAGLHCAPRLHEALGTAPAGCVRLSPGAATPPEHVEATVAAVAQLAASPPC